MRFAFLLIHSALFVVLGACQPDDRSEETAATELSEPERARLPVSDEQARAIAEAKGELAQHQLDEGQQAALALAIETLGERLNLAGADIEHRRVHAVEWPDSSLGCPEPGKSYLQVVTPGYLVSLRVDGKIHTVHVGGDRAIVCDRLPEQFEQRRALGQKVMGIYQAARADLAGKLKIDPNEVNVTGMKSAEWPDSSLGCPEPGKTYDAGPVEGFVIKLTCRGRDYEYRTDSAGSRFMSCAPLEPCHETE